MNTTARSPRATRASAKGMQPEHSKPWWRTHTVLPGMVPAVLVSALTAVFGLALMLAGWLGPAWTLGLAVVVTVIVAQGWGLAVGTPHQGATISVLALSGVGSAVVAWKTAPGLLARQVDMAGLTGSDGLVGIDGADSAGSLPTASGWLNQGGLSQLLWLIPAVLACTFIMAFLAEMLRPVGADGRRARLVESVSATMTGAVVLAANATWIAVARMSQDTNSPGVGMAIVAGVGVLAAGLWTFVPQFTRWSLVGGCLGLGTVFAFVTASWLSDVRLSSGAAIGAVAGLGVAAVAAVNHNRQGSDAVSGPVHGGPVHGGGQKHSWPMYTWQALALAAVPLAFAGIAGVLLAS